MQINWYKTLKNNLSFEYCSVHIEMFGCRNDRLWESPGYNTGREGKAARRRRASAKTQLLAESHLEEEENDEGKQERGAIPTESIKHKG